MPNLNSPFVVITSDKKESIASLIPKPITDLQPWMKIKKLPEDVTLDVDNRNQNDDVKSILHPEKSETWLNWKNRTYFDLEKYRLYLPDYRYVKGEDGKPIKEPQNKFAFLEWIYVNFEALPNNYRNWCRLWRTHDTEQNIHHVNLY
ncbi:hypothetical protein OGA32_000093 [Salmonella enterica]|nr:hypothetical protein [Salmonella enterica]